MCALESPLLSVLVHQLVNSERWVLISKVEVWCVTFTVRSAGNSAICIVFKRCRAQRKTPFFLYKPRTQENERCGNTVSVSSYLSLTDTLCKTRHEGIPAKVQL